MRIGDALYFAPGTKYGELNFQDTEALVAAYRYRVEGYYLLPAARCLEIGDGFAGGLVCCAAIECIASFCGREPEVWIVNVLPAFHNNAKHAKHFWDWFRNGLSHNGRIRNAGEFSVELAQTLAVDGDVFAINPELLLGEVSAAFKTHMEGMTPQRAELLAQELRRHFRYEIAAAKP